MKGLEIKDNASKIAVGKFYQANPASEFCEKEVDFEAEEVVTTGINIDVLANIRLNDQNFKPKKGLVNADKSKTQRKKSTCQC